MTHILVIAWHFHVNAILGLLMGASSVPLSATCIALYIAGRKLTPSERRSRLGIWLGRWLLWMGVFLACIAVLSVARWTDLDPDIDYLAIATMTRAAGAFSLIVTVVCTWFVGPLVLERIRSGRL